MIQDFKNRLLEQMHRQLQLVGELDLMLPDCPDLSDRWQQVAASYMPDGIREFSDAPMVSLGWMMYVGMGIAAVWDADWSAASATDVYQTMHDARGYDYLDEYVREELLHLAPASPEYAATERLVGDCAARVLNLLDHSGYEPGTPDAFRAYVACLEVLYTLGYSVQLHRMGYRMTPFAE